MLTFEHWRSTSSKCRLSSAGVFESGHILALASNVPNGEGKGYDLPNLIALATDDLVRLYASR